MHGQINELKRYLSKWLKGTIWIYATSCVVQELNSIGEDYRDLFIEAKKLAKLKCGHITGCSPDECFKSIIGENNPEQYWICTQDTKLREELKQIPGVPLFYFQQDIKLDLEEPAQNIKKMIQDKERQKYLPNKYEMKEIKAIQKEEKEREKEKKLKEFENEKKMLALTLKKKAKAPNPLSMLKKKRKLSNEGEDSQNEIDEEDKINEQQADQQKRKRTRVRTKRQNKDQIKQNQNEQQFIKVKE